MDRPHPGVPGPPHRRRGGPRRRRRGGVAQRPGRPSQPGTHPGAGFVHGNSQVRRRRRSGRDAVALEEAAMPGARPDRVGEHSDLQPARAGGSSKSGRTVGIGRGVRHPELVVGGCSSSGSWSRTGLGEQVCRYVLLRCSSRRAPPRSERRSPGGAGAASWDQVDRAHRRSARRPARGRATPRGSRCRATASTSRPSRRSPRPPPTGTNLAAGACRLRRGLGGTWAPKCGAGKAPPAGETKAVAEAEIQAHAAGEESMPTAGKTTPAGEASSGRTSGPSRRAAAEVDEQDRAPR